LKNIYISVLLLCFVLTQNAVSQSINESFGAASAAMGNTAVHNQSIYSVFGNQAGLANVTQIGAAVQLENRFLIPELQSGSILFALPTKSGTFGVGANYYGFDTYNQQQFALSYGRKLFEEKLSIGASFNYLLFNFADFGNTGKTTFGIGLQYFINSNIRIAAHVFNPIRIQIADNPFADDYVETAFKLGLAFEPSEQVGVYLEAKKTVHYPAEFRGGIEYFPVPLLVLRAGFATVPSAQNDGRFGGELALASFGAGVHFEQLKIDLASRFHPQLGHTPTVSLAWLMKDK